MAYDGASTRMSAAKKVAAIERKLMKLKIGTRRRLLRFAYFVARRA